MLLSLGVQVAMESVPLRGSVWLVAVAAERADCHWSLHRTPSHTLPRSGTDSLARGTRITKRMVSNDIWTILQACKYFFPQLSIQTNVVRFLCREPKMALGGAG